MLYAYTREFFFLKAPVYVVCDFHLPVFFTEIRIGVASVHEVCFPTESANASKAADVRTKAVTRRKQGQAVTRKDNRDLSQGVTQIIGHSIINYYDLKQ